MHVMKTIQTDVPKFRFTELSSNLTYPSQNNIYNFHNFQKEYVIKFYKQKMNKLLRNLSFVNQYVHVRLAFYSASWMAIVTPTDRPKSVRFLCNRSFRLRICVVNYLLNIFLLI